MELRTAAARQAARPLAFDCQPRRDAADIGAGFYDSSFDLRRGLEVCEAPVALLSEEILREFRRQRAH